jgi:hypothetical protein
MRRFFWVLMLPVLVTVLTPRARSAQPKDSIQAAMSTMNAKLASQGANVRLAMAETHPVSGQAGQMVYFNNRTLWLDEDWVPRDPNRRGDTIITWLSEKVEGAPAGISLADAQAAIGRAMNTLDSVRCASIPLAQLNDHGMDWGYVQYLVGMGGVPGWYADYTIAGWLPAVFFDTIGGPGASASIIGVTFTFVWVDENGEPTDMDNNRKGDVAFRETYYNDAFPWGINTNWPVDIETVVLHEAGHGLSLGHFGKLFQTDANGKLHFAPVAVMNAGYTGKQQSLKPTDIAAFCAVWAAWPNR